MTEFNIQVKDGHYDNDYESFVRFASYYHQIKSITSLNPKKILEVGIGNGTIANYLKSNGFELTTCDFDKNLSPDIHADIRNLPADIGKFDLVCAFEILEHLPWEDIDKALEQINNISTDKVIISLPYSSLCFELVFRFPFADKIFKHHFFSQLLRIPLPVKNKFNGEHYWEIGKRGFSKKKIRTKLNQYFNIIEESTPVLSPYHYFFVCEKKVFNKKR